MSLGQAGVFWPLKTLLQGAGISITEDATTIRIVNTGGTGGGSGDMLQSQYAPSGIPGKVDHALVADTLAAGAVVPTAQVAQTVPWSGVTGAPSSFPSDWSVITSKPSVFPPATHGPSHRGLGADPIALADINDAGLLTKVSGKSTDFVDGTNKCQDLPGLMQLYGALPPGTCVEYYGAVLPTGTAWVWANGEAISRTQYAALFAVFGTTYGAGDGSTTFNVPDKRGRVGIGAGQGTGLTNRLLGAKGGEENHLLALAEVPSHTHSATPHDPGHTHGIYYNNCGAGGQPNGLGDSAGNIGIDYSSAVPATTNISVTIGATGGGAGHNNLQPFLVCNFIIKT